MDLKGDLPRAMADRLVMPSGHEIRVCEDGRMGWIIPECEGELLRPFFGAEKVLLEEVWRLREALSVIGRHSVCCDARHCADRVLSGGPAMVEAQRSG